MTDTIFKSYDIRGIYPDELNEDIAYKIGRAFVLFLNKKCTIAVGRDMRLSSPSITEALVRGIVDQGGNVIDLGLTATPTLYFTVAHYGYDGGVQITASHNPKEYNGMKLVCEKAVSIGIDSGLQTICDLTKKNFPDAVHGHITQKDVLRDHIEYDLRYVEHVKPLKVVADPANAMGSVYLRELFTHIPGELVQMNFELDGTFPVHQADPLQDETLADLKKRVVAEKADLGIATDGDGDRIFFVDNNGETVPQPILRGVMAQLFLKKYPGAKICYDIRPGKITEEMIRSSGGIPIKTRVGHTFIKETMRKEGAVFAGESSGHYFTNINGSCYETPVIVILKLLEWMSEQQKPLSELIAPHKKYWNSGEINFTVQDKDEKIKQVADYFHYATINWMDGLFVETETFWFNLRKSNTEPLLRLNLEAVNREVCEEKVAEIRRVVLG